MNYIVTSGVAIVQGVHCGPSLWGPDESCVGKIEAVILESLHRGPLRPCYATLSHLYNAVCSALFMYPVADLEGAEPALPPPLGRRTDRVTHGHVS